MSTDSTSVAQWTPESPEPPTDEADFEAWEAWDELHPLYGPFTYQIFIPQRCLPVGMERAIIAGREMTAEEAIRAVGWYFDKAVQCAFKAFDEEPDARFLVAELLDYLGGYGVEIIPTPRRPLSASTRRTVFERDHYRCRLCGTWVDLQADHVIPHSKGGPDTVENLQTLCQRCNARKAADL